MNRYFTIGMAGHIDHGKTTLTKALTGVDTDRLKEEKERNISIEPGFAPLIQEEQLEASIIDVPGHEKFIRQMIAGVAGIDMVILVIAADEGVMPQTKEHLDILSLLGVENGIIVITKIDQADEELLAIIVDDVKEQVKQTFLEDAPFYFVDSIRGKGISALKNALQEKLLHIPQRAHRPFFRLPIDQVFTVKGQGVVVRGTIYDGEVREGERLRLLPADQEVRVRQIQRHHQQKTDAFQGQRAAINISGISKEKVTRGDVLVSDEFFSVSDRIDIVFYPLQGMKYKIKQRQLIKLHIGTSEVMGKIIFFDRNEVSVHETEEILCQIDLSEKVVVTRGDRFIIRRPTPVETIGGGWVIEPNAKKYRFGKETIERLTLIKEGTTKDRILSLLKDKKVLTDTEILNYTSAAEQELNEVKEDLIAIEEDLFTSHSIVRKAQEKIIHLLKDFHQRLPMRMGINKAEVTSELKQYPESLLEFTLEMLRKNKRIKIINQYVSLICAHPTLPSKWKTKLKDAEKELIKQGAEVEKWNNLLNNYEIPREIQKEFYYYLIETKKAYLFDQDRLISKVATDEMVKILAEHTNYADFTLQIARDILQLTRKNLVPLLELFDELGYTKRVGNKRTWITRELS